MRIKAISGPADLLHSERDPRLGVVVVIHDAHCPVDRPDVVVFETWRDWDLIVINAASHPIDANRTGVRAARFYTVTNTPVRRGPVANGRIVVMAESSPRTSHQTSNFLRACRGEAVDHTPVWFMRQAGRSLPEYREIRGKGTILTAIAQPDLATEITLQPVRRYGVDAAILYSDIMTPVHAIGFGVDIKPGVGPVTERPFASAADLDRLRPLDPEADTPYVLETVRNLVGNLDVPLIAFAGAPFTVASYLLEGQPSRTYTRTKALMHTDEKLWHTLLDRLAELAIASLRSQVAEGASAIQLFDSWAGALSPSDYQRYVMPASEKVLAAAGELGVPRIHFGVNTGELLPLIAAAGAEVVGVDWRTPLDAARSRVPKGTTLQGNLDPALVVAGWEATKPAALDVLDAGSGGGHVFNLGHGVLPETNPEVLERLVDLVHNPTAHQQ